MRKELLQKNRRMSVKGCKEKASMIAAVAERSKWPIGFGMVPLSEVADTPNVYKLSQG